MVVARVNLKLPFECLKIGTENLFFLRENNILIMIILEIILIIDQVVTSRIIMFGLVRLRDRR